MKFEKMIRAQGILIALGAALLLASAARAQQEVEPTTFEVAPGVPGKASAKQSAESRGAQNSQAAEQTSAAVPAATQSGNEATREESVAVFTAGEIAAALVLITGIGMLVLSAITGRWPKRYGNR